MRIVLVRHPRPAIPPGFCYGRLDMALHPAARRALPQMAAAIARTGPRRIWSSPAARCRELAGIVALASGAPLAVDARLSELDFGDWEGKPWDAVPRVALDSWAAAPLDFAPPGGESGRALLRRVRAAFAALLAMGEDCVVIAHGGPLKLLAAMAEGRPPDLLAPAPPLGATLIVTLHESVARTAHSASTDTAPSTSPV